MPIIQAGFWIRGPVTEEKILKTPGVTRVWMVCRDISGTIEEGRICIEVKDIDPATLTATLPIEPCWLRYPSIEVINDYDGYFERFVRRMLAKKGTFEHEVIRIDSGPYRSSAVSYTSKDKILELDFYSALRRGFGSLTDDDYRQLVALL